MADIINLRQARKAKGRADSAARAAGNRAKFGRSKAEKEAEKAAREKARRALDGAERETE
ncbi:MAG TPA: DUF4169 family protein [Allosphingosinicella sp.]|jgi:hypothetical protein